MIDRPLLGLLPKGLVLALALLACAGTAGAAEGGSYRVGPGDVLRIDVWREPDLSREYAVTPRGTIQYPLLGEIPIAGKTTQQIKMELTQRLEREYLVNPVVSVGISVYQSQKVFLFGHVARPGLYYLREEPSLLKILLEAGGPAPGGVSSASILRFNEISKTGGSPLQHLRVDLNALFVSGDLSQDISLQASDIIFVTRPGADADLPGTGNQIYVLGEVRSPGVYTWHDGYTALNAVLDAGGLTEFAAANRVRLVRKEGSEREVTTLRLGDIVKGELDKNIQLQPGDLISVPESFF